MKRRADSRDAACCALAQDFLEGNDLAAGNGRRDGAELVSVPVAPLLLIVALFDALALVVG